MKRQVLIHSRMLSGNLPGCDEHRFFGGTTDGRVRALP
jgi:hypothetical protein